MVIAYAGFAYRMAGLTKHNFFNQRNLEMNHREHLTAMRKALAVAAVTIGLAVSSVCAAQETVIHTFKGDSGTDGSFPSSGMVFDANGNLFGTTSAGGVGEFRQLLDLGFQVGDRPLEIEIMLGHAVL